MFPVLTPNQAAEWDRAAEAAGIPAAVLMENAGRAVAALAVERFGALVGQGVLVACGTGNNGGDGWVAARALHRIGVPVWVAALQPSASSSALAATMAARARQDGVRTVTPDGPWPGVGLVIDAVLGTRASGAPRDRAAQLLDRLVDLRVPVVAVDGPSGLGLLDGVSRGPLHASLTVTFGGYRRGHLLARDQVGDVVVVDIGFPPADPAWPTFYTRAHALEALPPLRANLHKGGRGRVAILGGDRGLTGAARLVARAALGAGAGLVHVLLPPESLQILAQAEPDIQTRPQAYDAPLGDEAKQLIDGADAVVIGPGLGRHENRPRLILEALSAAEVAILDADALTMLQGRVSELAALAAGRLVVLTPHLGEFRTLFPSPATHATVDPWGAAARAAAESGATVLLKGVPTVIADASGAPLTVAAGNPGLATGGSGDILSGLIATFLAQGIAPRIAAALGAQVLGEAADLAARRTTARGLRPMDVIVALPELWRMWGLAAARGASFRVPVLHQLDRPLHF